jgi:hypothetical protein
VDVGVVVLDRDRDRAPVVRRLDDHLHVDEVDEGRRNDGLEAASSTA